MHREEEAKQSYKIRKSVRRGYNGPLDLGVPQQRIELLHETVYIIGLHSFKYHELGGLIVSKNLIQSLFY